MSTLTPAIPADRALKLNELGHIERTVVRELIRAKVGQEMFCPTDGSALDVKKSVAIVNARHDTVFAVMSREAWTDLGPGFLADDNLKSVKFYDPKDQ